MAKPGLLDIARAVKEGKLAKDAVPKGVRGHVTRMVAELSRDELKAYTTPPPAPAGRASLMRGVSYRRVTS